MNTTNSLDILALSLSQLLGDTLETMLGPRISQPVAGALTWADLGVMLSLLVGVLFANSVLAAYLRKHAAATHTSTGNPNRRAEFLRTFSQPLHLLLWLGGLYLAATPVLARLPSEQASHPLRQAFDQGIALGVFAALFWCFFRGTRVLEERLALWASKTEGKLDDLLVPLIGRTLRVIVPVVGLIFALPVVGLPEEYAQVLGKGSSILIIAMVAWISFQAVNLGQKAVLAKYDISVPDNLQARKIYTQVYVLSKTLYVLIAIFTAASILMLFDEVRRFGTSLLASAGVIGIIVGFAAQRTIANLFAGFQLAMTQPIRLDDVVIVEGEWGRVEEITLTYVVVRIWDERRLIVPLSHFIEKPFQNWTRASAALLGSVFLWVDYSLPLEEVRRRLREIVESHPLWDKRFWNLQVTDANERAMQIRVLATAADSGKAWTLRCDLREKLISIIQQHHPGSLPKIRTDLDGAAARPEEQAASRFLSPSPMPVVQ